MTILLPILFAEVGRGGAERYTAQLARALLALGHDVATAAIAFDPDWPGRQLPLPAPGLTRSRRYLAYLDSLDRHLREHRYDIVHAMLPVRQCDLYHPHAGVVAELREHAGPDLLNPRRWLMSRIERDLLTGPRPPLTLALSDYVLTSFRRHYPDAPTQVLRNGVDTARFDPAPYSSAREPTRSAWGAREGELVLLSIAQNFVRKGIPQAVEALSRCRDLPLRLVVLGRDDPGPVRALARRLGVADRVALPGPTGDPRPAYAAADCFLLPTRHDPCSLVVLEALAMRLPVISTIQNGATEYMTPNRHGWVLPEPSVPQVEQALRAAAQPGVLATISEQLSDLRSTIGEAHHVATLVDIYRRLCQSTQLGHLR